jgi:hypothetical protein
VGARAGIISDPDTEVLDLHGALLVDLMQLQLAAAHPLNIKATHHVQGDDLAVRLLDLSQLHQEIPETRLCNHSVWRKDSHSVQLWGWVCLTWQMAANDLVFRKTT